ncbi:hypothetical protein BDR26DRAFT_858423 [Obelidium mucronatum]|nr:hypothetical protein BDR26DRAFT_858423 [Obelidium mucronatum]
MIHLLTFCLVTMVAARPVQIDERSPNIIAPGWSVCGGYASLSSALVSDYVPPSPIGVSVAGTISSAAGITDGITSLGYTLMTPTGQKLFSDNKAYDTCSLTGIKCPIPGGAQLLNFQIPPPTTATSSSGLKANTTINVVDQEGKVVLCLNNPSYSV